MKKILRVLLKALGILAVVLLVGAVCAYFLVLRYPELPDNPTAGKWYRVTTSRMMDSEGSGYHALFRMGDPDKVMVYFAGGGVSVNEETARDDTYNTREVWPDLLANVTMNMGGLASDVEGSPFEGWTLILFPYATGDFHCGAGEFPYTDTDGSQKILHHNGYVNYTETMREVLSRAHVTGTDTVVVTGYSAGGFATALLSDDIFSNYFPDAASKNVLVDAALLRNADWHRIAREVWHAPDSIAEKLVSDNLTLDCLRALHEKYGNGIHLLFDCSTRDGDLAKVQNYFDYGIMDVDEAVADVYQQMFRETVPQFREAGVSLFVWDGVAWYDDPRNMTAHTIVSTPAVWLPFEEQGQSVAGWLTDAMAGEVRNYGVELLDKVYE